MVIKSSRELLSFYRVWLAWAEADAPEHPQFKTDHGMCFCLDRLATSRAYDYSELVFEMQDQFLAAELDPHYPFGYLAYQYDCENESHHRREERLNWVKARISDGESESETD